MNRRYLLAFLAFALLGAPAAGALTFTDDFEGGTNAAGWAFLQGGDVLEASGGNPGGWLHQPVYDTFGPSVSCAEANGTPFVGDYRAAFVSQLSFDLLTAHTDFPTGDGFNVTLVLRSTNGTPDDIADDDFAYFVGPLAPEQGEGWLHYAIDIPSQSGDAVPAGWSGGWLEDCAAFRPGVSWLDVITQVDRVEILWLPPCMFAIFQQWNVGVDNIAVEYLDTVATAESSWGDVKQLYGR
jgi:hypothetical protein